MVRLGSSHISILLRHWHLSPHHSLSLLLSSTSAQPLSACMLSVHRAIAQYWFGCSHYLGRCQASDLSWCFDILIFDIISHLFNLQSPFNTIFRSAIWFMKLMFVIMDECQAFTGWSSLCKFERLSQSVINLVCSYLTQHICTQCSQPNYEPCWISMNPIWTFSALKIVILSWSLRSSNT